MASTSLCAQTVSLEIESGNFADRVGEPVVEGTLWGIVVDTTGDGFGVDAWGRTTLEPGSFLQDQAGNPTGAWLGGVYASDDAGPAPDFHPGWFSVADGIPGISAGGEASFGDQWGIVWFPDIQGEELPYGTSQGFGFFTRETLTFPTGDSTAGFSEYIGSDLKPAEYYWLSDEGGPMYIIPEPSVYALMVGVGALLIVVARRRNTA